MKKYYLFSLLLTILLTIPLFLFPQWTNNPDENTMISDTTGEQTLPKIVVNSSGESFISWFSEMGDLNYDVYMQKLDPDGNKLWDEQGLMISDHTTNAWLTNYDLILDQEDCAVLVKQDQRTGTNNVFAYRISPNGDFLWGNDGIALSNNTYYNLWSQVMETNDGDFVFIWYIDPEDTTQVLKWQIGMQKVSKEGELLWGDGMIISSDTMNYYFPQILLTEDDNFIVSWLALDSMLHDTVLGHQHFLHVFAHKYDSDGNPVWPSFIQVDTGDVMQWLSLFTIPFLENDGNGGAYLMWQSFYEYEPTTLVNHIGSDGELLWPGHGTPVSLLPGNSHAEASMKWLPAEDKLYVFWKEYHYDNHNLTDCFGVYGQLFSSDGQYLWSDTGKVIVPLLCSNDTAYWSVRVCSSDNNDVGVFYAKEYYEIILPDTFNKDEYYAARIDMNGNFVWDDQIVEFASSYSGKGYLVVSDLIHNQWIAVWSDDREAPGMYQEGIYAQNIHSDGTIGPMNISEINDNAVVRMTNFPNPFANSTTIMYELTESAYTDLSLSNIQGKLIKNIYKGHSSKGIHYITVDASGLDAGIYLYSLKTSGNILVRKMVIIR